MAPQVLGQASQDIELSRLEDLHSSDLSESLPGDLLQIQDGEHEIDRRGTTKRAAGTIKNAGTGGDRVWKESLMPDEKKAIQNFFK